MLLTVDDIDDIVELNPWFESSESFYVSLKTLEKNFIAFNSNTQDNRSKIFLINNNYYPIVIPEISPEPLVSLEYLVTCLLHDIGLKPSQEIECTYDQIHETLVYGIETKIINENHLVYI